MKNHGFTLIEMAIVTILIGILLGPLLFLYQANISNQRLQGTRDNIEQSNAALSEYVSQNNSYPCPASLWLDPGDPNYGEPDCRDGTGYSGLTVPNTPGDCHMGICRTVGRDAGDADTLGDSILIGAVPFKVMNEGATTPLAIKNRDVFLPASQTLDGWGNKLTYVVTESMTKSATFNLFWGAISVVDENGYQLTDPPGTVHLALISHGDNGVGAYTRYGQQVEPCSVMTVESDNCNQNILGTLVSGLRSIAAGPDYNDDVVKYIYYTASSIWENVPGEQDIIFNTPGGFVGVGTDTPTVAFDVVGDVVSVQMHALEFCGQSAAGVAECYKPEVIGGNEPLMQCPAGEVVTEIQNGSVVCEAPPIISGNDSCPSGEFVVGISNMGNVRCCPIVGGVLTCP